MRPTVIYFGNSKPKSGTINSEIGYQIYDTAYPAPLPFPTTNGLFGQLFGIAFLENYSNKALCQSISTYKYISCFGYNVNFTNSVSKQIHTLDIIHSMMPH